MIRKVEVTGRDTQHSVEVDPAQHDTCRISGDGERVNSRCNWYMPWVFFRKLVMT